MGSNWLDRVGSVIPRGFSRHYILGLLKKQPMSGKEIIDKAVIESEGIWKPSPGLIYPLLGRLLEEKLIEQTDDGRYKITLKGIGMTKDIESVQRIFQKQLEVVLRVGSVSRFAALDLIDRVSSMGSALSSNIDKMTAKERNRYKHFLTTELTKLEDKEQQQQREKEDNGSE
jgi:DNA-binding PadR family transcriptional regulator